MLKTKNITLMVVAQHANGTQIKYFTGKPGKALDKRAEDAGAEMVKTHGTRNVRYVVAQVIWIIEG